MKAMQMLKIDYFDPAQNEVYGGDPVMVRKPNTDDILIALINNNGYCPCKFEQNDDTKCPCKEFREKGYGECSCGLYVMENPCNIIYTKEGCPKCNILKRELKQHDQEYIELTECLEPNRLEFIMREGYPVLVDKQNCIYNYLNAMRILNRVF